MATIRVQRINSVSNCNLSNRLVTRLPTTIVLFLYSTIVRARSQLIFSSRVIFPQPPLYTPVQGQLKGGPDFYWRKRSSRFAGWLLGGGLRENVPRSNMKMGRT